MNSNSIVSSGLSKLWIGTQHVSVGCGNYLYQAYQHLSQNQLLCDTVVGGITGLVLGTVIMTGISLYNRSKDENDFQAAMASVRTNFVVVVKEAPRGSWIPSLFTVAGCMLSLVGTIVAGQTSPTATVTAPSVTASTVTLPPAV